LEETDGRVSWVRMRVSPEATRGMNSLELAQYHGQIIEQAPVTTFFGAPRTERAKDFLQKILSKI